MKTKQIILVIAFSVVVSFMLIIGFGIEDMSLMIITFLIVVCLCLLT